MANGTPRTDVQTAWLNFVKSVRGLLVPQTDDRPLDQYLAFRDAVLTIVESEQFLGELNAWSSPPLDQSLTEIRNALLLELQAFPRAVELAQGTAKAEESQGWLKKMLGRAPIVAGSVQDLIDNLPPHAKNALTLLKELVELFKGNY